MSGEFGLRVVTLGALVLAVGGVAAMTFFRSEESAPGDSLGQEVPVERGAEGAPQGARDLPLGDGAERPSKEEVRTPVQGDPAIEQIPSAEPVVAEPDFEQLYSGKPAYALRERLNELKEQMSTRTVPVFQELFLRGEYEIVTERTEDGSVPIRGNTELFERTQFEPSGLVNRVQIPKAEYPGLYELKAESDWLRARIREMKK